MGIQRTWQEGRAVWVLSWLAGALAVCAGAVVLVGWSFVPSLLSRLPGSVPMMPNTAIGLILLGAATLAAAPPASALKTRLARAGAMAAGVLGALTLGEYVSGVAVGIDQFFLRVPADGLYPGRMAPDSAFCLALLGAGLWLRSAPRKSGTASVAAVMFGMLPVVFGLTVLIVKTNLGGLAWLGAISMAVMTAVSFAALGSALAASILAEDEACWTVDRRGTAACVSGLVLVASAGLYMSGRVGRMTELDRRSLRQEQALQATSLLVAAETDAETAARGALISGDARLMKPYAAARAQCEQEVAELRGAAADDPERRVRTEELAAQVTGMLDWWKAAMAARRPGPLDAAALRTLAAHDRVSSARLTAILAGVQDEERRAARARQEELGHMIRMAHSLAAGATLGGLSVIVIGMIFFNAARLGKRQDEERVRNSEIMFRILFENSWDALMTAEHPNFTWSAVNRAAVAMFRAKDEADLLSRTPMELSPEFQPDGRPSTEAIREHAQALPREGSRHFEWTHRRLDGTEFPADVLLTFSQAGGKSFVQATVRDLSETNREASARRLLAQAIEQASESVVITDTDSRILFVNPAFERVTGYSREEALGKKPSLLKSGRHDKAFYEEMWATLARGEVWHGRIFNRRKDGAVFEEDCSIAPVRGDEGRVTHYIAVKRDVSNERALEAQLQHSQRMESVGRLAGGIAHDFNNILTAIIGSAQLLGPAVPEGSLAAADVSTIIDSSLRAAGLTRQLLTFSRRQAPQTTTFDLNSVVADVQRMLKRTLGERVLLAVQPHAAPVWIKADAGGVGQVLLNLSVNARDAMPKGGTLTISTSVTEFTSARVTAQDSAAPGVYALLRCADTGAGMSADVLGHIFEPFFTTKEKGKGTGLGLSTVYGIVKQSGGHLFVDSAPGQGAVFEILFPLAPKPPKPVPAAAGRRAEGSETILLVEDEEPVLKMVERTLKSQGYTILSCRNAEEALTVSAAHRGGVDLVLTDVVMSGMSGPDLARVLAVSRPGVKVLFMSGYPDGRLESSKAPSGGNFLQKPFQLSELTSRVRLVLDA
jgi:two-component system cell cycle sensor histidine kinase/response regulator CckA